MKILLVLDSYLPVIDGPAILMKNYAEKLSQYAEVEMMVPYYPKFVDEVPYKVHRVASLPVKFDDYRVAAPIIDAYARSILKNGNYDIIHLNSPFELGRFVLKSAKRFKIPVLYTMHTKYHSDFNRLLKTRFARNFMMRRIVNVIKSADCITAVNQSTVKTLHDYGINGDFGIIKNGTELKYPDNAQELIESVNERFNLKNQKNVFLFVGRIVQNKNVQFLLRTLKILKERNFDFKFLIVGDGNYLEDLKEQTQNLNIEDNVIFTNIILDRQLLSGLYLRSDLFLFASTFDTVGIVTIEAAAMKLPCLVPKNSSCSEAIEDGISGFCANLVENEWADKIESILDERKKLMQVGEQAHKDIYVTLDEVTNSAYEQYKTCVENYKKKVKSKK